MSQLRQTRLGEQIQREIAQMLVTGALKDDRIGFTTVTAVELTVDLDEAKVFYVVHGDDAAQKQTADALAEGAGRIRSHLGRVLRIRQAPRLRFVRDRSIDEGDKIDRLLREVRAREGW